MLVALPLAFFLLSICIGRYGVSIADVCSSLFSAVFGGNPGVDVQTYTVVVSVRLPRALQGLLVGASLAASGACFQSLFRNPLVSSGMLGVSSGAGFGAALSIVAFGAATSLTPLFAFGFGVTAVALSYFVGKLAGGSHAITLVLGGTIIQSVFSALLSLLKYLADAETQLPAITFWLMGSLASTKTSDFFFSSVPMLIGMIGMVLCRWRLNILSMGDREARTLGLNVQASKLVIIAFSTLATAGAVCTSGVVGWIGLVVPHICRMLLGNDNKWLIPASISVGACFMVLVDTLCRTVTGAEIPLGIVTALVGAPFFVYLLKRTKAKQW